MNNTLMELIIFWTALIACLFYAIIAGIVSVSDGPESIVKVFLPFILGAILILTSLAPERWVPKMTIDFPLLRGGKNKIGKILFGVILIFVSLYWLTVAFVLY
ncbi:hypothetical protein D3OALGA1CA_4140 [Olavius algarvensis associated proteobacterium Delta 3]|nr:hypothetical protein D3OALGB2SA_830 [Olavius algarvensis associated proteobacterium Delta 3]CAB5146038.1 hypothetical protein D3OALGA1CA_4140 [Olavius algarvensis associated proteobacterium Delta 3]